MEMEEEQSGLGVMLGSHPSSEKGAGADGKRAG